MKKQLSKQQRAQILRRMREILPAVPARVGRPQKQRASSGRVIVRQQPLSSSTTIYSGRPSYPPVRNSGPSKYFAVKHRESCWPVTAASSGLSRRGTLIAPCATLQAPAGSLANTFPWLCNVGHAYDLYRFKRLTFEYVSQCSATTVGRVTMGYDPSPSDDATHSTPDTISSWRTSVNSSAYSTTKLTIPCDNVWRHNRTTHSAFDLNSAFMGKVTAFTSASTAAGAWGTMYAEYEVEFDAAEAVTASYADIPQSRSAAVFALENSGLLSNGVSTAFHAKPLSDPTMLAAGDYSSTKFNLTPGYHIAFIDTIFVTDAAATICTYLYLEALGGPLATIPMGMFTRRFFTVAATSDVYVNQALFIHVTEANAQYGVEIHITSNHDGLWSWAPGPATIEGEMGRVVILPL